MQFKADVKTELNPGSGPTVAVVGAGISGLGAALRLHQQGARVTLFESAARAGGHAHTVDVTLPDADGKAVTAGVDTGFLVCNQRTYTRVLGLFDELGIERAPSDMSFSVQSSAACVGLDGRLEWCGSDLGSVFAQPRNLLAPGFWRLLLEILRFNRLVRAHLAAGVRDPALTVGRFLDRHRFGRPLRDGYLLPMLACIWSCPAQQMMAFPFDSLADFCANHGLVQVNGRPPWLTVAGGSRRYVDAVCARLPDVRLATPVQAIERVTRGVQVRAADGGHRFDAVVLACHAPQSLALLGAQASPDERRVLGALRTHVNRAVLHTDADLLPRARKAWAAWNYERADADAADADHASVCLHYLINRLQPLPFAQPVIVSLNPLREPRAERVLDCFEYAHPVYDAAAFAAQARVADLQGRGGVFFAGAWLGYGFHEDGLRTGEHAAAAVLARTAAVAPRPVFGVAA